MSKQFSMLGIILLLCFYIQSSAMADEDKVVGQDQVQMSMMPPGEPEKYEISPIEFYMDFLNLNTYSGDLSLCKDDKKCLEDAASIKSWVCVASVCDGQDKSKVPTDCFDGISSQYSAEVVRKINDAICPLIKSPSNEKRKALMDSFIGVDPPSDHLEDDLVRNGAHILAINGSGDNCEKYIKDYVGPFGPKWNNKWFMALSACRILSHKSTREQEQQNFYTWFGAYRQYNCASIRNPELSKACQAVTSGPPSPYAAGVNEKEPLHIQTIVERIGLKAYEAAMGDLAVCEKDEECLQQAKKIKGALCIAKVCAGDASDKDPVSCLGDIFGVLSENDKVQINKSYCSAIKSMDSIGMQQLKSFFPKTTEKDLVEFEAYVLAASESAASCLNYVQHYVGPFGPQWNYKWYRALSGCRIIGKESSRLQEESDFYVWIASKRKFSCDDIVDSGFRNACRTVDITKDLIPK